MLQTSKPERLKNTALNLAPPALLLIGVSDITLTFFTRNFLVTLSAVPGIVSLFGGIILGGVRFGQIGERRRWHKLVPGLAHGPDKQTGGFTVFIAEKEACADAAGSSVEFVITPYEWGWNNVGCFRKATWLDAKTVPGIQTSWPAGADVQEVAAAWFDFCQLVEELNSAYWADFQARQLEEQTTKSLAAGHLEAAAQLAAVLPSPARR